MINFFKHIKLSQKILFLQNQMYCGHVVEITPDSYRDEKIRYEKHD